MEQKHECHCKAEGTYNPLQVLLLGVLVIFWWAGVWGLLETLIQKTKQPTLSYSLMILIVVLIVFMKPHLLEHFL
jgi:hypothetical protein